MDKCPDLVFGYYAGGSRRLAKLFDGHRRRYYDAVNLNDDGEDCREVLVARGNCDLCLEIPYRTFTLRSDPLTEVSREASAALLVLVSNQI